LSGGRRTTEVTPASSGDIVTSRLFAQPWWLDAVAPGNWGEATVMRDGKVIARLPWARDRLPVRGVRLTRIGSPPLTPYLAPELELGTGKQVTRLAKEHKLLTSLSDDLPSYDYLSYTFDPSFTNWLPFYWKGLTATLRATYVLDDIRDLDAVWRGMSDDTRNVVRKAEALLSIQEDEDATRLTPALASTFARQRQAMPFSGDLLARLTTAVRGRGAGKVLTAVDENGTPHGSLMVVWDDERAYYLTGGTHTESRRSGAQSLLVWHAIRHGAEHVPVFDFEGSMIEGVAQFFRGFGSRPTPYLHVTGTSRRLRLALAARELAKAAAFRR
jgi:hypothetical protein